jgi:hypothetical protein
VNLERILRRDCMGKSPEWNCRRSVLRHSPSSCDGLGYGKRALSLLPDDYRTRCYTVRAAYVLSDSECMQWLRIEFGGCVDFANDHRKAARDLDGP